MHEYQSVQNQIQLSMIKQAFKPKTKNKTKEGKRVQSENSTKMQKVDGHSIYEDVFILPHNNPVAIPK